MMRVLTLPRSASIAIIGGGIIGASISYRLTPHAQIILLEAATIGSEASWAGAGMLVPGSEYDQPSPELEFALESLRLWPTFVQQLQSESALSIDFSLSGSLELAASQSEAAQLQARAQRQAAFGIASTPMSHSDLPPGIAPHIAGGVLYPNEGQVDPRTVTAALRSVLERKRVRILEHTRVTAIRPHAKGVELNLADGSRLEADAAVLAAGAWTSLIESPTPLPRCYPVRGHLIGYQLPPGSLPHVLRFHHTYVVQRRSGYTISGTSEEQAGFDRTINPATVADIAARAHSLAPGILPAQPRDAWIGFRPGADNGPFVQRLGDAPLWAAYGHYRNGILLAPATAARIEHAITSSSETTLS